MRVIKNIQMEVGEVDIAAIKLDLKSRDDIPKILKGLQYIYTTPLVRDEVFKILEKNIAPQANKKNGRPGMEMWKILVMGILRLDLNCDYDRLQELVNNHKTIRLMLGHVEFYDTHHYHIQTLKDNVNLLTPELLDEINQAVVKSGHILLKKKENDALHGRCDSFVLETNVHYPTDANLLYDAMRKVIELTARICDRHELSDWRQSAYNIRHVKKLMRATQNKKRGSPKTEEKAKKREREIKKAHEEYISVAQNYLDKSEETIKSLGNNRITSQSDIIIVESIHNFKQHALRQIDQIDRRVLKGEIIPHEEKVFSIFQTHTEWVSKGKAGVPVELGVKVCVMEDQYQFILFHHVMEKQTDDQVAILMVMEAKKRFPNFNTCSFDKGFHSPENQKTLGGILDVVAMKRKGKLSEKARATEASKEFKKARHKHSAVESVINEIEVHGLDRCLDHGIDGFKSYVSLAIAAHNIRRIGAILINRERKIIERRRKKYLSRDNDLKKAA